MVLPRKSSARYAGDRRTLQRVLEEIAAIGAGDRIRVYIFDRLHVLRYNDHLTGKFQFPKLLRMPEE